jgi:hypothetical protein
MTVATTAAQECCRLTPVHPRCRAWLKLRNWQPSLKVVAPTSPSHGISVGASLGRMTFRPQKVGLLDTGLEKDWRHRSRGPVIA